MAPAEDILTGPYLLRALSTTIVKSGRDVCRLKPPCPELCMNTGWISKTGPIIVCMPNRYSAPCEKPS